MIYFQLAQLFSILVLFGYLLYYLLNLFQQEHYDYQKFVKLLPTFYFKKTYTDILYIYLILVLFNNIYHTIIFLLGTIYILIKPTKYIVKLKLTPRIIRMSVTLIIILMLPFVFIKDNHLLLFTILLFFVPFELILVNIINYPVEQLIRKHYLKLAKKKLQQTNNLIKIAITGSYGKTSTKNILNHVLSNNYITLATPKSYNTLMGITKTINAHLNSTTEIFIMEMGAFRKGEIKQMVKEFPPNISVITEIGPQHLSTFKSIEGVLKAKLEIISNQAYESPLVINNDNKYLKNVNIIKIKDIYKVGINEDNQYYVRNIKIVKGKTIFEILNPFGEVINIESPLLGNHNVLNIVICYGIIQALKQYNIVISNDEFIRRIKTVPQIPHRLEYKCQNNLHIYDDSYNSNVSGFTSAIELFQRLPTKKVLITPGIVDGGKQSKEINENIAQKIIKQFDEIYLIRNQVIIYYVNIFHKYNQEYKLFNSFKDAFNALKKKYKEEVSVLIENDLPDNFLER